MLLIVPSEEVNGKSPSVLNTAETSGVFWAVLHGLKLAFREWIIIGNVRAAMGFGDSQVSEQLGDNFGFHG